MDPAVVKDRFPPQHQKHLLEPGIYAIVHSLMEEVSDCAHDMLLQRGKLHMTKANEPIFIEANVESIVAAAFVVPNLGGKQEDVFILKPIDEWASLFY